MHITYMYNFFMEQLTILTFLTFLFEKGIFVSFFLKKHFKIILVIYVHIFLRLQLI